MARLAILTFLGLVGASWVWIFHGAPIHDINLWMLERQFTRANIDHPVESFLLGKRSYLGPSHYGGKCVYATGEVRRTELDKDKTRRAYQAVVRNFPLQIYFTDESELPYEIPFGDWQSELEVAPYSDNAVYIVYVAQKHHYLGDQRCDD